MTLVRVERAEAVRTIVLDRPERRNALSRALQDEFVSAIQDFDADDTARVAVVTGTDPAFCAGVDLTELGAGEQRWSDDETYASALRACRKVVIGAVNGPAVAGGFELALGCDFLIASERAVFADTHGRVGVLPGGGLTVRLAEAVGVRRARRLSLTGEFVDAATAYDWGLVTEVVPHEQLLARASAVAAEIAAVDPAMADGLMTAYARTLNLPADEALDVETEQSRGRGIPEGTVRQVAPGLIDRGSRRVR